MIVQVDDWVAISVLHDHLKAAIRNTDSSEPDSFGDKLFCVKRKFSNRVQHGDINAGFLREVCDLMNGFDVVKFIPYIVQD